MTVINYYKPQDLPLNLTKTWVPEAPAGVTEITVTVDRITGYDQNDKPVFAGTGAYQHEIKVTKNGDTWTGSAFPPGISTTTPPLPTAWSARPAPPAMTW